MLCRYVFHNIIWIMFFFFSYAKEGIDAIEAFLFDNKNAKNPSDILKNMQNTFLKGRALDITSPEEALQGKTNFIMVDRYDILKTALEEIEDIEDPFFTLEVQFYGEVKTLSNF